MERLRSIMSQSAPYMLSILRIVVALLFIEHGTQKLFNFPPSERGAIPVDMLLTRVGIAGILEFGGGLLLLIGLFTRPVAFILAGEMAFAYFLAHSPQGIYPVLNGGELAALYCFTFLYFFFTGAGPWSIDALFRRTKENAGR